MEMTAVRKTSSAPPLQGRVDVRNTGVGPVFDQIGASGGRRVEAVQ